MQLIFFDLDGTLLNDASEISPFTKETLLMLNDRDIAYTVATGRTMLSAQHILEGHSFKLPHIYSNGVTIWDPSIQQLTFDNLLLDSEISLIINIASAHGIAPFVNVIDDHHHYIFHPETRHDVEKALVEKYFSRTKAKLYSLKALPLDSKSTNISMIGDTKTIQEMSLEVNSHENLIAYSGQALEGKQYSWMDVHHKFASKGNAVTNLKQRLGATNVICFGDGDNDVSMFELADESYAPSNAKPQIRKMADSVIGHNHNDGIAHFLRERFSL